MRAAFFRERREAARMEEKEIMENEYTESYRIDANTRTPLYLQRVVPNLAEIRKLVEQGVPDYDIAAQLHVSPRAWKEWKKKYPEMREMYENANQKLVARVVNALYKAACGYTTVEKKTVRKNGQKWTEETEKYIPPNTTAAVFFLTNRAPDEWKHRNTLSSLHLVQKNEYNIELAEKRIQELVEEIRSLEESPENPEVQD